MNNDFRDRITLIGMSTEDKWFDNTLKALIFSKQKSGIKKAKMLCSKIFYHPDIECIKIDRFSNMDEYNFFMLRKYGDYLDTDFALNIHDDGFILNMSAWTDEFMNYDYIGALWTIVSPNMAYGVNEFNRVGNGGFSLRSKKFLNIVKKYCPFISGVSEDVTSCRIYRHILIDNGIKFAPNELAAQFSIEDDQAEDYIGQKHADAKTIKTFGFHQKGSDAIKLLNSIVI